MGFSDADLAAILLSLRLAATTTILLLCLGTPIAWWLATSRRWWKAPISAVVAMPLILPPTVLGFYLLVVLGPNGPGGQLTRALGLGTLPFTFWGLVIGSIIYSLPFVVQPIQNAIEAVGPRPLEVAATLRASPWQRFWTVLLPLSGRGFMSAAVLGFAHTVGEFGLVLMIGGNIPGVTRVASVQLYDHVEALDYVQAHWLAGVLVVFAFLVLLVLYSFNPGWRRNQ